jgi:hypothetical protein
MTSNLDDYDLVEQIIAETLETWDCLPQGKLDWVSRKWAVETWARIFKDQVLINVHNVLAGVVLANRHSCMGRFALNFNAYLAYAFTTRDEPLLEQVLSIADKPEALPEVYDNEYMQKCQISRVDQVFNQEIKALWMTYQKLGAIRSADVNPRVFGELGSDVKSAGRIVNSRVHAECFHDVCTTPGSKVEIDFLNNPAEVQKIYLSERHHGKIYVWSFDLYDLIRLIVQEKPINPYNGEHFEASTLSHLAKRFQVEISMFTRGRAAVAAKVPSYYTRL